MAVHINEMVSDISAEPDSQNSGSGLTTNWSELEQAREAVARLACDRRRTAAEGYDD